MRMRNTPNVIIKGIDMAKVKENATTSMIKTNANVISMDMANADLVVNTTQKMDFLDRQLYIQSQSFDEVVNLFKQNDEILIYINEDALVYKEKGNNVSGSKIYVGYDDNRNVLEVTKIARKKAANKDEYIC